jgi:uncharacterized protein YjbJ (UPF0337 family)
MTDLNKKNSITEETAAIGHRVKGAVKDAAGAVTGNESLEREGEAENAEGRARQGANEVLGLNTVAPRSAANRNAYVTGLYRGPEDATRAYEGLTTQHGYKAEDVDLIMSDESKARYFGEGISGDAKTGTKAAEGLGKGGAIGGGVGAALAAAFAVGSSIAVPGLGLVVAGPIAAALAGAGAGAATGGLIGALIGVGIPEDRVAAYESGIRDGGIVVGTRARNDDHAEALEQDFRSYGGTSILR